MKYGSPMRGELYFVNFDPTVGAEIQKTRPALILQNNIGNTLSDTTIVAAVSTYSGGRVYPFEVLLSKGTGGVSHDSLVLLNHIRTIDKQRLLKKLGTLELATMKEVAGALSISVGGTA